MKQNKLVFILLALFLTACNLSLAEDITPPPNYVPPTPMPTLGPLFPADAPDIENGAAIYAEKCVDCHGPQGMGDGEQGKQLPVTVAALGLPQVARAAAPVDWYTMVTRGNIERFMPPFVSIGEQERWDVVAYALSLHTDEETIGRGKELFETNCANCPLDFFQNQETMASLSADEIVALLKNGSDDVTALSGNLTDDDYYAVAAYLRSLTFAVTLPTPTPEPVTPTATLVSPEMTPSTDVTPGAETTPVVEGTPATETSATPVATEAAATPAGGVKISGSVSGPNVAGLNVTLRGYDHATDSTGANEVVTLTAVTDESGAYVFEGLEVVKNRIFFAEIEYAGVTYSSDAAIFSADPVDLTMPPVLVYETTEDYSTLVFDQAHFFIEVSDGTMQVIGVYTFSNTSDKTIVITAPMDVPFIKAPADAQNVGFDLTQDSAPIFSAGETGFAMPPSETPYGFVEFYTLPYTGKVQMNQPFALPSSSVLVLVPDGMKAKSSQLTEGELQSFQGTAYRSYSGVGLNSGDTLTLDLSGQPKSDSSDSRQGLLIGVGALGAVLILAGAWMYWRERQKSVEEDVEEDDEEDEMESEEDLLDAIIALDDLHRSGKISGEAYQTRRAELKARLKNVM